MPRYVGVDGCSGGWFAVAYEPGVGVTHGCYATFEAVVDTYANAERLLVDMPIGLPETGRRRCDEVARKQLGPRASTVFFAPCRAVLDADDHQQASELNHEQSGYGLSIQAWHLVPKVNEVDTVLRASPALRETVAESHPELCFAALGDGPVTEPKSTAEGREERLRRLRPWFSSGGVVIETVYESCLDAYYRRDVQRDDVLDAAVLALAASRPLGRVPAVSDDDVPRDAMGLPMEILAPESDWFVNIFEK